MENFQEILQPVLATIMTLIVGLLAAVAQAAPMMPSHGSAVSCQFRTTLATAARIILTIGIVGCPSPWRIPVET